MRKIQKRTSDRFPISTASVSVLGLIRLSYLFAARDAILSANAAKITRSADAGAVLDLGGRF
jgi:hypothetical protein